MNGYYIVVNQEYALQDDAPGKDLDVSIWWEALIRRGMKTKMGMVFYNPSINSSYCPRCGTRLQANISKSIE